MQPDDREEREWLTNAFLKVRSYFARAAELQHAMLMHIA
jgi:hypothetical protein